MLSTLQPLSLSRTPLVIMVLDTIILQQVQSHLMAPYTKELDVDNRLSELACVYVCVSAGCGEWEICHAAGFCKLIFFHE